MNDIDNKALKALYEGDDDVDDDKFFDDEGGWDGDYDHGEYR